MKSEELLELLNGIGSDIVENAGSVAELYEGSREGVSFRAEYSRKRILKTVIVSIAATAAAMFGLFALLNVVKGGFFNYHGGHGDPDRSGYIYGSEEQTFTKDYDGLLLTVTTDKSVYKIGEPIKLTASLENNTGRDISLCYGGVETNNSVELMPYFEGLIGYPRIETTPDSRLYVVQFKNGEKSVREFTFLTDTYFDTSAAPGVYDGKLRVMTCSVAADTSLIEETVENTLDFSVTLIEGDIDSENKGQTFTKDFDGLVLTVTTDKTEYNIGDTIHLTATLENNRDEEVYLYYGMAPIDYTVELSPRFEDLIEYPHDIFVRNAVVTIITVKPGEKYVQDFTFLTYTDYIESGFEYYPDYSKPAAPGVHNGTLCIWTCPDEEDHGKWTEHTLDFSVRVNGETSESKNKAQTFTKDFDGLVLTVTTDKSTYNIGEPIELTATLENNTGKDIILYYGTCGTHGYDGQKAGTTAELLPRFDKLIEYPIRSAVWFNDAITEIPFKKGEKCVQKFTFQTYTGYLELDYPPQTGEFKNAVVPDMSKVAESGVHYGKLTVMIYSDGEARDHITDCTLDFSVTVASSNENNDSDTENKPSEKMTGIYSETEIPDIPCGDKDYEGKANVIQESDALRQCLESMVFETHNFGDYTVKLIGDSVRTDKKNFPGSIYAQKLRIEIGKNGTKTEDMIYNDTLLYQSQFHTEYRLFADKIGSYLDIYKLECPVIAMRYFFDDDPARTVTKAVEFAVIQKDRLCGGFVGTSAAGTGVTMNPNMDWSDYRTILAPNTSDGERCRLSVFAADEFTVIDGKTLTDEEAGIEYTFDFSDPPPFELYAAEKIMS